MLGCLMLDSSHQHVGWNVEKEKDQPPVRSQLILGSAVTFISDAGFHDLYSVFEERCEFLLYPYFVLHVY